MLELYGTRACPYTAELREDLALRGRIFCEYDVELDVAAMQRIRTLVPHFSAVPVLVEDGQVTGIGFRGRSCYVLPG